MKGVVILGDRRLEIREFAVPEPGQGQVLVRMKASSLCGSDLRAIYRRPPPPPLKPGEWRPEAYGGVIAGHEPCGIIEKAGPGVARFKPGDRVVMYHIVGCGLCHHCRRGWMINCSSQSRRAYGWQRDGGHAEFLLAEERSLVALPDALTYVDGAMIACGFGTAYAACERVGVSGNDTVLITGLGPVGLGAAMLCKAMGARVIGTELIEARIAVARKLGLDLIVKPGESALRAVMDATGGQGCEVTYDCSGNPHARHFCLEAARDWGRVVFVGEGNTVTFEPSPLLLHKQLTLHGSWVCSLGQMEALAERLVRWHIHPEDIVTHRFVLEQAKEAYELFDTGKTGKVAIVWDRSD
ncbi:MAG: zinc-binding dehydrogenase [Kiritimatiellae bacterium]|nr:zinc-binding dehydrogenase [Kiritimatiellia bacterium]